MLKIVLNIAIFGIFAIVELFSQTDRVYTGDHYSDSFGNSIYEFPLGKYNLLHYRVNIMDEPSIHSNIVATLNLNDEIEILENPGISENINNVWAYWYKIKYGNIIGYTFGGNIAVKTLVVDNILCFYRVSSMREYHYSHRNFNYRNQILPSDLFIYINGSRISNEIIEEKYKELSLSLEFWNSCSFFHNYLGCNFSIGLLLYGTGDTAFDISSDGNIRFVGARY